MLILFSLVVLFFSVAIHEIAHGSAALALGDQTAKYAGRLSLNPLKHIDPFGSIMLPIFMLFLTFGQGPIFGWAKPVPVNPINFREKEWGMVKVSIAGPAANFIIALFFGFLVRFLPLPSSLAVPFNIIIINNLLWGLFNLVPIPPLDGSHIFFKLLPEQLSQLKLFLQQYGFFVLIFFAFFGLRLLFPLVFYLYQLIVGKLPI